MMKRYYALYRLSNGSVLIMDMIKLKVHQANEVKIKKSIEEGAEFENVTLSNGKIMITELLSNDKKTVAELREYSNSIVKYNDYYMHIDMKDCVDVDEITETFWHDTVGKDTPETKCVSEEADRYNEKLKLIKAKDRIVFPFAPDYLWFASYRKVNDGDIINIPNFVSVATIKLSGYTKDGIKRVKITGGKNLITIGVKTDNPNIIITSDISIFENLKYVVDGTFGDLGIPNNKKEVKQQEFYKSKIKRVVIPEECKLIGDSAFKSSRYLEKVEMGSNVEKIGCAAFAGCINLKYIDMPESCNKIESVAFENCESLEEIRLPDSIKEISPYTFENCRNLRKINIPKCCRFIWEEAFRSCHSLKEITFPEGLEEIREHAFYNCYGLTEIVIPKTVYKLDRWSFRNCWSLRKVTILNKNAIIHAGAFDSCSGLEEVNVIDADTCKFINVVSKYKD